MSRRNRRLTGAGLLTALLAAGNADATASAAASATTSRVSVSSAGRQANGFNAEPLMSAHGRYVAFFSEASNLVSGDTNGAADVFLRDRLSGATRRVSVGPGGRQANEGSFSEAMSSDGRYVVFTSAASNLVAGDTNGVSDVFVRDVQVGTTQRVSVSSAGDEANGNAENFASAISANGRYVVFTSSASNLVAGDTNGPFDFDVFLRDRVAGTTERISLGAAGLEANGDNAAAAVSADGRYVLFSSFASNLVPGDSNFSADVFLRDRRAGTTRRVSLGSAGQQAVEGNSFGAAISADGRFIAFSSAAANLVPGDTNAVFDAFVRDRSSGITRRMSQATSGVQGNGPSVATSMSANGRYVAFDSVATNLVPGDTNANNDVFVRDRQTGQTRRTSLGVGGRQANGASNTGSLSADGLHVAFSSDAPNLVAADTNKVQDVFARDEFGDAA